MEECVHGELNRNIMVRCNGERACKLIFALMALLMMMVMVVEMAVVVVVVVVEVMMMIVMMMHEGCFVCANIL